MRKRIAWGLSVAIIGTSRAARADGAPVPTASPPEAETAPTQCAPIAGGAPELRAIDARVRLAFVRDVMRDQASRARTWMWGWGIGGLALAGGNYGLAALYARGSEDRTDAIVGGTTSLFIPAAILVNPLTVPKDQEQLEAYVAETTTPEGPMDPCVQLARAEEFLKRSAENEAKGRGFFPHAIAIGGNLAIGLVLWLGYDHLKGGLVNGLGGIAISEVQIFTQPIGAERALEGYTAGDIGANPSRPIVWSFAPLVIGNARGISLVGAF